MLPMRPGRAHGEGKTFGLLIPAGLFFVERHARRVRCSRSGASLAGRDVATLCPLSPGGLFHLKLNLADNDAGSRLEVGLLVQRA